MNTLLALGLGVMLGMQHATEADHLAAVATLMGRERSVGHGLRLGVAWGCGHMLTLLVVAAGVGLLGWVISPQTAGHFEQAVGVMLMALGTHLAWRLWRDRQRRRDGRHGEMAPRHHGHPLPARSLLVGMMHGLAGSGALALTVGPSLPGATLQLTYVALFGLGSIIGMALLSGAVAFSVHLGAGRLSRLRGVFNAALAAVSVLLGLRLLVAA